MRKTFKLLLLLIFVYSTQYTVQAQKIGGNFIVFEAEDTESDLGLWEIVTEGDPRYLVEDGVIPPINGTHIEFTGNNEGSGPATSPLVYKFVCPKTAEYAVNARMYQRLEGAETDKCNDVYIKLQGNYGPGNTTATMDILSNDNKYYGRGINSWGSLYRLDVSHAYHSALYNLIEGQEYTFTVSGRSQRCNLDYWIFYESSLNLQVKDLEDEKYLPPITKCKSMDAIKLDFTGIDGFVDASTTTKDGLDVLQVEDSGAFAAAQMTFLGTTGEAYFSLNTLQEKNGESDYILKLNGEIINSVKNDRIFGTDIPEYSIQNHMINETAVMLDSGDVIQIEFNSVSNGLETNDASKGSSSGLLYSLEICTNGAMYEYGLTFIEEEVSIMKNDSLSLDLLVIMKDNEEEAVVWTSLDSTVASVDSTGLIKAISRGSAEIIASNTGTAYADTCFVNVIQEGPFSGTPSLIPGKIEAEDYDIGENGSAYYDNGAGNEGNKYREDDVDIQECGEGGYNVGWIKATEWLAYTVNVEKTDDYQIHLRYASTATAGFHVEVDDVDVTGTQKFASTGDYQVYNTYSVRNIELAEGIHKIKLVSDIDNWNTNWIAFYSMDSIFPASKLTITAGVDFELLINQTKDLNATISPINATDNTVLWTSNKPEVASVDENGVVTGIAYGETTITATNAMGEVSDELDVHIVEVLNSIDNIESIELSAYPNPFSTSLNINTEKIESIQAVEMYTIFGQLVYKNTAIDERSKSISITPSYEQAPAGIYYIQIIQDEKTSCLKVLRK